MSGDWWWIAAKAALLLGLGYYLVPTAIGIIMGSYFWLEAVREEPAAPRRFLVGGHIARGIGALVGLALILLYATLAAWSFGWLDGWVST